jgi:A/G-specific adenine glycosylase
MRDFENLLRWYKANKRDLPWRNTNNPYFIWLSEIILQQTRVEQGMPYYLKFIEHYPTIEKLAKAQEKEVLKLWQGLGYYSRARNMHETAKLILHYHDGIFPNKYEDILALKGIGSYTAAAIASFAFNQHKATVDGNIYRVLSRYFEIDTPINSTSGKKQFETIALEILSKSNPAIHNQALMELGAMICKPIHPKCDECPIKIGCLALKNKSIAKLPVKTKKANAKKRYLHYYLIRYKDNIIITQRTGNDIWKGLYELPATEYEGEKVFVPNEIIEIVSNDVLTVNKVYHTKHILTHQYIYADFFDISISKKPVLKNMSHQIISVAALKNFPVSRLFDKFIKYYNLH